MMVVSEGRHMGFAFQWWRFNLFWTDIGGASRRGSFRSPVVVSATTIENSRMATPKDEIMARSGPEDRLRAFPSKRNTSPEFTAGPDWGVFVDTALPTAALHYKDEGDMKRLHELLATEGPSGRILRDTATSRYICSKQSYSYSVRAACLRFDTFIRAQCCIDQVHLALTFISIYLRRGFSSSVAHVLTIAYASFFYLQTCFNNRYAHQRKACTPADLEYQKCGIKL